MNLGSTTHLTITFVILGIAVIFNAVGDMFTQKELSELKNYIKTLNETYFEKHGVIGKINVEDVKYVACHCLENEVYCKCVLLIPKDKVHLLHNALNKTSSINVSK